MQVAASIQAQQYETRQVGFSASQMKEESSDSLVFADEIGRKFDKFLNLSKTFFSKGYRAIPFHQQVPMLELHTFTTYEQFEEWIFQVKDQNEFPNATHEKCLMMEPWKDQFSVTQRLKINGWLGTLMKMDRIKLIKRKVRSKKMGFFRENFSKNIGFFQYGLKIMFRLENGQCPTITRWF